MNELRHILVDAAVHPRNHLDVGRLTDRARRRRRTRRLASGVVVAVLVVAVVAAGIALVRNYRQPGSVTADGPSSTSASHDDRGAVAPIDGPYVLIVPEGYAIVRQEHLVPDYEAPGLRSNVELRDAGGAEAVISMVRELRRGLLVDVAKGLPNAQVTEITTYDSNEQLVAQEAVLVPAGARDRRTHLIWQGAGNLSFDASFDDAVSQRERQQLIEAIRFRPAPPAPGIRIDPPLPAGWADVAGSLYVDVSVDQPTPPSQATVATFDVPAEPSGECDYPIAALERLGPDDAFVSVVDRGFGDPSPRPPATDFLPLGVPINLVPEGERDLTTELCLVRQPDFRFNETSFAENGRIVRVFVGIGLEATPETEAQVLDVVSRIAIEAPTEVG